MTRAERVHAAWLDAFQKIAPAVESYYSTRPREPMCLDAIKAYAPGAHNKIESAEKNAEEVSVRWRDGGPGGVQAALDAWVDAWLEGIAMVTT